MDSKGYWHNERPSPQMQELTDRIQGRPPRPVIECEIGETVTIMKDDETSFVRCIFEAADKNKVFLSPLENSQHQPYWELAERVKLTKENGESVNAQIWDNRRGKIVVRTLPV